MDLVNLIQGHFNVKGKSIYNFWLMHDCHKTIPQHSPLGALSNKLVPGGKAINLQLHIYIYPNPLHHRQDMTQDQFLSRVKNWFELWVFPSPIQVALSRLKNPTCSILPMDRGRRKGICDFFPPSALSQSKIQ